jgi:tetratricopeptide (TPR) repeat protein
MGKLEPFMPFIVRIKGETGVGLGFCVGEMHVITCAHVVNSALGLDDYSRELPKGAVTVEFIYANDEKRNANVIVWHPKASDEARIDDIAVLELDRKKPSAISPVLLKHNGTLFDHPFWALGYTARNPIGIYSHGTMCPALPNGRVQIENPKDRGIAIDYGFSGSPVWDEAQGGVAGMVAEALFTRTSEGAAAGEGIAFIIPNEILIEAWPDLEEIAGQSKKIQSPSAYVFANKGATLYNLGRIEEATRCLDKALAIDPGNAAFLHNKGVLLDELGQYRDAVDYYNRVLEVDPSHKDAWYNKGNTLRKLGQYKQALDCYDEALRIDPSDVGAWHNKGLIFEELHRYREAVDYYNRVLEIDPENAISWFSKGNSLQSLGRHEDAIDCYDEALRIDPSDVGAWYNKGLSLQELGRNREAIECFAKANALK